jgi:hypothetical protein
MGGVTGGAPSRGRFTGPAATPAAASWAWPDTVALPTAVTGAPSTVQAATATSASADAYAFAAAWPACPASPASSGVAPAA